jgi:3-methyladenine DNA glycosylase Mpg
MVLNVTCHCDGGVRHDPAPSILTMTTSSRVGIVCGPKKLIRVATRNSKNLARSAGPSKCSRPPSRLPARAELAFGPTEVCINLNLTLQDKYFQNCDFSLLHAL